MYISCHFNDISVTLLCPDIKLGTCITHDSNKLASRGQYALKVAAHTDYGISCSNIGAFFVVECKCMHSSQFCNIEAVVP